MAEIVEYEEKVFEHYFMLSPELRMMIIDKMQAVDRCRFTRCSKSCNSEAKKSKKYVYGLKLICWSEEMFTIEVKHGKSGENGDDEEQGFLLTYLSSSEGKFEKCVRLGNNATLWKIELDGSTDLFQRAIKYLQNRMKEYQYSLRKLCLDGLTWTGNIKLLKNANFGIERLENLEELDILGHIDASQIFSKLQLPLKKLNVEDKLVSSELLNFENIYRVEEELSCWNLQLNFQQLIRLSAKYAFIRIGKLTEKDILCFIRCWQNETTGNNIMGYQWDLRDSNFCKNKLLRLLRISDNENGPIEIKHHKTAGMSAILLFDDSILRFNAGLVEDSVFLS